MSLTLSTVTSASLASEREAHFVRLGEGPELYLELLLRTASSYRIGWNGQPAGYCIKSADGLLAELELQPHAWLANSALFTTLIDRLELRGARCFSFDSLLLGLCVARGWTATVEGPLFRNLLDERGPDEDNHGGLQLCQATPGDFDLVVPHREGVFDTDDECREWIVRGHVSVLRREGAFLGIGLLTRVWSTRCEHDVGVMVHPDCRGHGYASFILRSLKRCCLDQGMRPTAGCAAENVASSRSLHRAGFVSQHSLIKFERQAD